MIHDPNLTGFGIVLQIVLIGIILSMRSSKTTRSHDRPMPPPIAPLVTNSFEQEAIALRQQCAQLRQQLQQQTHQLTTDFQAATFDQLQPLFINYPTARKMAETHAELPARNLVALFSPLGNLLETWNIQTIGTVWEQVNFDPHLHQPDAADISQGEPVYIRFVGYRQGDRILTPAKVSRTLPMRA
ncbi:MAG: molecular chaperone GrpE [Leptolyngbyaceae cyanobacterium SL_7_1]|nr:molecular chaperone GrpE [Leptolyngbyaceae cyanobacterium SL_7_1]